MRLDWVWKASGGECGKVWESGWKCGFRAQAKGVLTLIMPMARVDGASCLPLVTPGSAEYYGVVERV